jgi:hypothetical protein
VADWRIPRARNDRSAKAQQEDAFRRDVSE